MKRLHYILPILLLASCSSGKNSEKEQTGTELSIPSDGYEFQLYQRKVKELPVKTGKASVAINDITGGQTWLVIADDTLIVFEKSIHEGDTVDFKLGTNHYRLTCLEMINELIGEDLVTLKVMK